MLPNVDNQRSRTIKQRALIILCLILAGEAVFALPFHVARFFRSATLEVFGLSNANLGDVFAVYGITAMLAYFPGGLIADRYSPRGLIALSLIATAAGGLYMATIPAMLGMSLLFAYWGVTTILLLWAALIRATREWGGDDAQGRAFGLLDGGRGLLAAGLASVAVPVFGMMLADSAMSAEPESKRTALVAVITYYSAITFAAGVLAWFVIPDAPATTKQKQRHAPAHIAGVLQRPVIWLQALIVIAAYCGYKGLDNYSLYAVEVMDMSDVDAAAFTAGSAYLRPVAAIAAGLLADRLSASGVMTTTFALLTASFGALAVTSSANAASPLVFANVMISFAGVYALRGVYFALMEETSVPPHMTGSAVGLISVVGFTPDIFFASISGRILDAAPGTAGHQNYFLLLAAIMAAGTIATAILMALSHRQVQAK